MSARVNSPELELDRVGNAIVGLGTALAACTLFFLTLLGYYGASDALVFLSFCAITATCSLGLFFQQNGIRLVNNLRREDPVSLCLTLCITFPFGMAGMMIFWTVIGWALRNQP